jgi:hypothetical protein
MYKVTKLPLDNPVNELTNADTPLLVRLGSITPLGFSTTGIPAEAAPLEGTITPSTPFTISKRVDVGLNITTLVGDDIFILIVYAAAKILFYV